MFIDDTQRSKAFYERVFGAKAVYEDEDAVAFEFENVVGYRADARKRFAHCLTPL
jgi:catechol 2,3-dioxygenase-like lactoylglutathione lyase family enzyme